MSEIQARWTYSLSYESGGSGLKKYTLRFTRYVLEIRFLEARGLEDQASWVVWDHVTNQPIGETWEGETLDGAIDTLEYYQKVTFYESEEVCKQVANAELQRLLTAAKRKKALLTQQIQQLNDLLLLTYRNNNEHRDKQGNQGE